MQRAPGEAGTSELRCHLSFRLICVHINPRPTCREQDVYKLLRLDIRLTGQAIRGTSPESQKPPCLVSLFAFLESGAKKEAFTGRAVRGAETQGWFLKQPLRFSAAHSKIGPSGSN